MRPLPFFQSIDVNNPEPSYSNTKKTVTIVFT